MSERESATFSRCNLRGVHIALPSSCRLTSQPPQCQNRSVCLSNPSFFWHKSAAWTSQEWRSPRRSVDRETNGSIFLVSVSQINFYEWISSLKKRPVCINVKKHKKTAMCSVSVAKQRRDSHYQSLHCGTLTNWRIDEFVPGLTCLLAALGSVLLIVNILELFS